tara:strand:- start:424 stop:1467 length:1044 start_codon:yes stop_codon:yes gene_type:complete
MNQDIKLVIISNEKTFSNKNKFFCNNIDMKSIPEGLNHHLETILIARKSYNKKFNEINLKGIKIFSNIINFIYGIVKTFKYKNAKYLLISVTPYTFVSYLLLFIFRKKTFIYLRSNGHEEYKAIFGFWGPLIYHIMYTVVTFQSRIIVCQKKLTKKSSDLVFPSELNKSWLKNTYTPLLDKPRLLYVGRIKVEKGIFAFLDLFKSISDDMELSITGNEDDIKINNFYKKDSFIQLKKINFLGYANGSKKLIKIYDEHNITILPSFTEAHPKIIDESLARERPVIVFEDIRHAVKNKYGVFISKRDVPSITKIIKFIMNNYSDIKIDMSKNKLPTKEKFIVQMSNILK